MEDGGGYGEIYNEMMRMLELLIIVRGDDDDE